MRRDITRLSLFIFLLFVLKAHAVPWREKTPIRFATTLPNRIIDSIMAQGNWNILFQEGPFAEFQRQIAVANHFALRGEKRPAEQYFSRAESALAIAYGSLRGRYGWPRSPAGLNADDLQWGENRETFQDYLLCRLQLYLESGLIAHENGELHFTDFDPVIVAYQKQLGSALQKKDQELDTLVRLIRDSLAIRSAREPNGLARADRFAALSDTISGGGKSYWNRRTNWFRIFENIHYGNLGRALYLAGLQRRVSAENFDALALARILVRCSDYAAARAVVESAIGEENNRGADSYADYLRYSELLQNLAVWQRDNAAAGKTAAATVAHLEDLLKSEQIPREEIVDVRNATENQKLRMQKHAYLNQGTCPAAAGNAAEHEIEWQVRERLFQENCGKAVDKAWWRSLLLSTENSTEIRALAAQRLEGEQAAGDFLEKTAKADKTTELTRFFVMRHRLQKALMRKAGNALPELLINYLRAAYQLQSDLLFLDWGIRLGDNLSLLALEKIPGKLTEKQAAAIFAELHRRYALDNLRGVPLAFFSAPDAAQLMQHMVPGLLDVSPVVKEESAQQQFPRYDLWYADGRLFLQYKAVQGRLTRYQKLGDLAEAWQKNAGEREALVFGNVSVFSGKGARPARIAPLFFYCSQCSTDAKLPERLVMPGLNGRNASAIKAELSDTFSAAPEPQNFSECNAGETVFRDTLFIDAGNTDLLPLPCDLRLERLVTGTGNGGSIFSPQVLLAMGWRKDLHTVVLPEALANAERVSFLYDLFQRTNRRQMRFTEAFAEAAARAEKSFPQGAPLQSLQVYGSFY